ncbi:DUF7266 family protein [Halogeometricum limi]|uniref:Uncharacterized protein n=1 Tax=Halogeometricum limi TaxID=555875 RepID=A0A1I6G2X6_9EURY|nr:hypothetical protein [Halogeometricum limi]SFR36417.1 hypothetical protein SAMN04488124_0767 [Halogeometricum limi]
MSDDARRLRRTGRTGRTRRTRRATADRGLSPVVGKSLELGIVVLFIALLTTSFYGSIVPDYRTAAAAEVGERALVGAAERVESAVPERTSRLDRRVAVSLPPTVRGDPYRVRAVSNASDGTTALVLDHPDAGIGGRVTLTLPTRPVDVSGTWRSSSESWAVVSDEGSRLSVELQNGGRS